MHLYWSIFRIIKHFFTQISFLYQNYYVNLQRNYEIHAYEIKK